MVKNWSAAIARLHWCGNLHESGVVVDAGVVANEA
jgi:hypothetical protein